MIERAASLHQMARIGLLLSIAMLMMTGLYGGLLRLGLSLPAADRPMEMHGALMVAAVFGGLISLERAVALGHRWAFIAPILSFCGGAALVSGLPPWFGGGLLVGAAAVLTIASLTIARMQPALFTFLLAVAAFAQCLGNLAWMATGSGSEAAAWWVAFLVLTIAAERLELSRITGVTRQASWLLGGILVVVLTGSAMGIATRPGALVMGLGLIGLSAWLLRWDIAMTTVRRSGRTRFFAIAMLSGYFWLATAGLLLFLVPEAALLYDVVMHAVLIGFVLSMVFAHALIILPAVTGLTPPYHSALYAPLAALQLAVVLRVAGGLLDLSAIRQWSGATTVLAIALFAATLIIAPRRR
ncbi:MAG: hypothetical protein EOO64_05415 [Massilia sp.]|nr:MAG: hypothetical protein EOO64_05415 [Massilia sp.]